MLTLLLLRHAKSSWKDESQADHERPLNKRGRHDAPRMGRLLAARDLVPDAILSSTAVRARLTAEAVAEHCGYKGDLDLRPDLYLAPPRTYVELLSTLPPGTGRVLAIGHNPGIAELVERLTGRFDPMPTAALAQITIEADDWSGFALDGSAALVQVWRPRELPQE